MEQPSSAPQPRPRSSERGSPPPFAARIGWIRSSGDYVALNTLIFMVLLLIQFGIGMGIDLFVGISRHHPGASATNFFSGVFDSVSWAILHGPIALAIHAALGLGVLVGATHNFVQNLKRGTRGTVWASGIGALFVFAAGFNGGAFLNYNNDVNSLLMALFFGAAILCYAVSVYVLMRSPVAETTG